MFCFSSKNGWVQVPVLVAGKRKVASVKVFKEQLAWKHSCLPPLEFAIRREALGWIIMGGQPDCTVEIHRDSL